MEIFEMWKKKHIKQKKELFYTTEKQITLVSWDIEQAKRKWKYYESFLITLWVVVRMMFLLRKNGEGQIFTDRSLTSGVRTAMDDHCSLLEPHMNKILWRPTRPSKTKIKKKDTLFIIGDWNAKAGNQEIPGVTDKFGLREQMKQGKG